MSGMPDVAPRIAVKDQIQRRGARRHLDRAGERHPLDRHVADAGPEMPPDIDGDAPASAATVTIPDFAPPLNVRNTRRQIDGVTPLRLRNTDANDDGVA